MQTQEAMKEILMETLKKLPELGLPSLIPESSNVLYKLSALDYQNTIFMRKGSK